MDKDKYVTKQEMIEILRDIAYAMEIGDKDIVLEIILELKASMSNGEPRCGA